MSRLCNGGEPDTRERAEATFQVRSEWQGVLVRYTRTILAAAIAAAASTIHVCTTRCSRLTVVSAGTMSSVFNGNVSMGAITSQQPACDIHLKWMSHAASKWPVGRCRLVLVVLVLPTYTCPRISVTVSTTIMKGNMARQDFQKLKENTWEFCSHHDINRKLCEDIDKFFRQAYLDRICSSRSWSRSYGRTYTGVHWLRVYIFKASQF